MQSIARAATERGIEIWSYKGAAPELGVRVLNHRRFAHIAALFRYASCSRVTDSSHFHLEYPHPILLPLWIWAKRRLGFTWIKILHDGSLPSRYPHFTPMQKRLLAFALRHINEMVVYSRELETWMRNEVDFKKPISFIPLLLPLPSDWGNSPVGRDVAAGLEQFGGHQKRVCSIGVFIPSYGFDQLAKAVEHLRAETQTDIGLLLIDGGFASVDEIRKNTLGGRDWITTLTNVPHSAMGNVFAAADCFVRPVEHESFGLSRVEAILSSTPVIATTVGETRGMRLYEFGDVTALTDHLRQVLFTGDINDTNPAAEIFRVEAEANLASFLNIIKPDAA